MPTAGRSVIGVSGPGAVSEERAGVPSGHPGRGAPAPPTASGWSLGDAIAPAAFLAGLVLLWHFASTVGGVDDYLLPGPLAVLGAGWETRDRLAAAVGVTLLETALGLAAALVLGVSVAAAMDLWPLVRRTLYPILVASQTIQVLAVAPLLVIWFGFGLVPATLIVVLMCFFPLAVGTADGLTSTETDAVALLRTMGASRGQIWRKARLPSALPSFFSGLRIAVTYAVVAATIGEWVGGTRGTEGLGLYILRSQNASLTAQVFVAMLVTTVVSIGLFAAVWLIERISLPWYHAPARSAQWEAEGG